jgi:rSAM/selenodomain-associated transferase 1
MHTAIMIMAKVPQAGAVKTRLCPPLSQQEAMTLYYAFLRDKIAQVQSLEAASPTMAYTPADGRSVFAALAPGFTLIAQQGADLGERLANAFAQCFAAGHTGVIAIDSDTPTLPTNFLQQAIALLAMPKVDVVIGPSDDGGYYLIGLRALHHELFENMPWSTDVVVPETVRRATAKGLQVAWLPPWFDVDTPEDLERLQSTLKATPGKALWHTRQFFLKRA